MRTENSAERVADSASTVTSAPPSRPRMTLADWPLRSLISATASATTPEMLSQIGLIVAVVAVLAVIAPGQMKSFQLMTRRIGARKYALSWPQGAWSLVWRSAQIVGTER